MAFLQYELWKDCNNGCKYCFNQYVPKKRNKLKALEYAINSLKSKNLEAGSSIGFMGGEFFGGQLSNKKVKEKFYELSNLVIEKLNTNPPGRFLIMSALMADDPSDWFEFCDFIHEHNFDKNMLICTSWDSLYRFNEKTEKNWENTVKSTQEKYPDMKIHVEMILTEYLIQNIMKNPNYLKDFEKKWNVRVDFNIPYLPLFYELHNEPKEKFIERLPDFLPKRKSFLTLLKERPNSFDLAGISDHRFHSSELHYSLNDIDWIILPERDKMETTCINHKVCDNCCGYADSKIKIQKDIKMFLQSCL